MLRAPVLMRNLRIGQQTIQKNIQKLSISKHRGSATPTRSTSRTLCAHATELNVQITIRDQKSKTDEGVFYKDDEDRFRQRYTLKLKTFSEYSVQLEVNPSLGLSYLKIGGTRYEANMTNIKKEDDKTFCSLVWSTKHIKTTQRKYRTILPCAIKFKGYKEIQFEVLVKFYEQGEVLHYSGLPLSYLGLQGTLSNDKHKGQMYDIMFN